MVAICPNPFRDTDLKISRQAKKMLEERGFRVIICPVFAEEDCVLPDDLNYAKIEEIGDDCSLILVVGGDGTILSVVRRMKSFNIPLLGINLGTKGFMANLEASDLHLVAKAAEGEYRVSCRMMLDVFVIRNGEVVYSDCALNDAVIHGYGDCVNLTVWCNGDKVSSFSGDGIILSTPTGSTGYSMSAGGPIVEPNASNIIISPICAHMMGSRSFVIDPERTVSVKADKIHDRKAYLAVDGNSVLDIKSGDYITVKKSNRSTLMADLGLRSFFEIAFTKLT